MKVNDKGDELLSRIRQGRPMTRGEKLKLIAQLSVPSILSQMSAIVMFFIDASMVGSLGARQSASIGLVESSTWLFSGLLGAASMGFSVQVAHAIGANDFDRARSILRQSLVCAIGEGNCLAAMTHKWVPYRDGVLFISRFWIGFGLVNGVYQKVLPDGVKLPDFVPKSLFAHNIKEFSNLAAILPEVYKECGKMPL